MATLVEAVWRVGQRRCIVGDSAASLAAARIRRRDVDEGMVPIGGTGRNWPVLIDDVEQSDGVTGISLSPAVIGLRTS